MITISSEVTFGQYLRTLRKNKGLTVRKLEELSGVSASYVTNVENGKRGIPSPDILQKVAEPLGVEYEELMEKAGYLHDLFHLRLKKYLLGLVSAARVEIMTIRKELMEDGIFRNDIEQHLEKILAELQIPVPSDAFINTIENINETLAKQVNRHNFDASESYRFEHKDYFEALRQLSSFTTENGTLHHSPPSSGYVFGSLRVGYELSNILQKDNVVITYFGHHLSKQERQRILDMLKVLFPELTPDQKGDANDQ